MNRENERGFLPYKIFIAAAFLVILAGVVMKIFNYRGRGDISTKYNPPESAGFSGNEVIFLGVLIFIVTIYLARKKRVQKP